MHRTVAAIDSDIESHRFILSELRMLRGAEERIAEHLKDLDRLERERRIAIRGK